MNTHVPEEYGGPGASFLDGCIIEEELSWGCSGITTSLSANGLAAAPLAVAGSEELKKTYLGMLTEDLKLASFCLTEPDAGLRRLGHAHERRAPGRQVRHQRLQVLHHQRRLRRLVHGLRQDRQGRRPPRDLLFLVPKDDTVTVDKKEDKMGQRASNTATITFNETEIPADHLIGEENKGFKIAMMTLDRTRPGVAAMATGIARAAFEFATNYSKERVQFGVPIAMHQAIQFMIADMATKVHLSRLATWNSAVLLDQGERNTLESSHAKRFAADAAMEVATDAVQVYGGYGFIKDYPVEKLMRDAKIMQLYEGTSQIQRLVIARETLLPRRVEEPAPRRRLGHLDRDVVGHVAEDGVVAARLLQQRAGHELADRPVRHQPRDEALPGDAAAEVAVEPERAMAGAEDLARPDRVGLRRHRGPVAAEGVQRVLHDGHRVQLDQPRAGAAVGIEVAVELGAEMRLPEGDVPAPADASVTDVGAAEVLDPRAVVGDRLAGREVDLVLGRAQLGIDEREEPLPHRALERARP